MMAGLTFAEALLWVKHLVIICNPTKRALHARVLGPH